MKVTSKIFVLVAIFAALLTYSSCDKNKTAQPSDEEVQLGKLSKAWKATSVTKDGADMAGYTNFILTISGTAGDPAFKYAVTGRPTTLSPWLSSGNWNFDTDPLTTVIRDKGTADELKMTYAVTETTLKLTFTFNGNGYQGRVGNVKGQWVMTFGL